MKFNGEKGFRDNLYDYIYVPNCIVNKIIDTELFQRLRDIEQTSMSPLFPCACHNRFVHSLGVYHLGKQAFKDFKANASDAMNVEDRLSLGMFEARRIYESSDVEDLTPDEKSEVSKISSFWWDKYERLFNLACLLHDCAHAPYSHTYELYYRIVQDYISLDFVRMTEEGKADFNSRVSALHNNEASKKVKICLLDKALLFACPSLEFSQDVGLCEKFVKNINKRAEEVNLKKVTADNLAAGADNSLRLTFDHIEYLGKRRHAEHEKLSAVSLFMSFRKACADVLGELLSGNPLVAYIHKKDFNPECEAFRADIEFMVRAIIGLPYRVQGMEDSVERSIKNCLISLLNSSTFDVDGLDYIMRDSFNSGIGVGGIDYQRLLKSTTVTRVVYVCNGRGKDLPDGALWLKGTEICYSSRDAGAIKGLHATGPINLKPLIVHDSMEEFFDQISDCYECEGPFEKASSNCVISSNKKRVNFRFIDNPTLDFKIECTGATRIFGLGDSSVSGAYICSGDLGDQAQNNLSSGCVGYTIAYKHSSMSVFEHTIDARNFKHQWIFSHPQVLYYGQFLRCYLLRLSARFLCSKFNSERKITESSLEQNELDFLIPHILGFESFMEEGIVWHEATTKNSIIDKVQSLYSLSSDADIRALFKQVWMENRNREDLRLPELDSYARSFFSRKHQRALWKSYPEYKMIFLEDDILRHGRRKLGRMLTAATRTSQAEYRLVEDDQIKNVFKSHGIGRPVCIPAKPNIKIVDPHGTYIVSNQNEVGSWSEYMNNGECDEWEPFFYVYGDVDKCGSPSTEELRMLFREILNLRVADGEISA